MVRVGVSVGVGIRVRVGLGLARPGPPIVAVRLVDDVDRLEGARRRRHCSVE